MKDLIVKGTGNSRFLKTSLPEGTTWEQALLLMKQGKLPVDFNGFNAAGITQEGTAMNKQNVLSDETKAALELEQVDPTINDALSNISKRKSGSVLQISFVAAFTGRPYTVTAHGESYSGTVPAGLEVNVSVKNCRTTYTVESTTVDGKKYSTPVTTGDYFGQYKIKLFVVSEILEENDWATIGEISESGQGANYWKVGDKKKIVINGMVGKTNFSNLTIYPFILGFNHNAAVEGNGRISWQLGKNAAGDLIALVDSKYGNSVSETGWFSMNGTNTNVGGWNGSQMCNTILGSHSTPANPAPNTLLAALPPELRAVMKPCTKYRDNTGGNGDTASKVTATTEYLPLLAEFEYFGARSYANSAEQNYQKQFDFYKAGNSKIKYRHDTPTTAVYVFSGSVYATDATGFCLVTIAGDPSYYGAYGSYAVSPSFCT